ncbi:hypothetical protein PENNAL_c0029G05803 [Penicillium nalgiovense]|uniref:Ubiquitin carboxyl-terminal hydrolase n=2 Tax=Penicillium nalgiovense TaxID=60175 RepID=A0A1V6Y9I8_PENNA|nr:hypothetical protein PENNAL_c0029G05803 [Penicillium nalgiovense]
MFNLGVQVINGQKTFIPLENNPEVHTHLCKNLGVSPSLTFHDILSTTPEMLSWIPRPVNALILLCDKPIYLAARSRVEHSIPEYLGSGTDEPVLWMKQTIGHACGLMALLHVVTNLENGKYVLAGSELEKIVKRAVGLGPVERARLLYDSRFLEEAHMDAASEGSSIVPLPQEECGFHFIAFVKKDGKVWELNGGMNGPLLRGELEGDLLGEEGLDMTILAVTRDINSASARKLAQKSSSITLIQGNLDDPAAIKNAKRVWGVSSVQTTNPRNDDERRQGIALINESIKQGVKHFVYSSIDRGGEKASLAFMNPEESKNHAFSLAGDELTFDQMSEIFKNLTGKDVPTTFRIPVWLMMAAVKDLGVMFKWFWDEGYGADIPALKKLNPA